MTAPARWRLLALVAALVLVTLVLAALPLPAALAQPGQVPRVYVLRGGDAASDNAVVQALRARGLDVVSGVETPAFDGTQVRLRDFDVLVVLYTQNWQTPPLEAGLQAIESFVEQGGGLVTGEWFGWRGRLAALMPAINCGWNSAARTDYTLVAPQPAVNQNLRRSFAVNLASFSGSESCLQPRPEASELYRSSNGGGRDGGGAGLVAWNYGRGRVAQFSTLLSATELANAEYRSLFQNVVSWLAVTRDTTPPEIRELTAGDAGLLLPGREATLSFRASDNSGGSGLGAYFIVEQVFSGDLASAWTVARTSGWQPYQPAGVTLTWTLSDQPGVHYLQVYVADRAGNISRQPGVALLNYRPALVSIGQDEIHIYRFTPGANRRTQLRMDVGAGNPDLYVFGPGLSFNPESDDAVEETPTFAAQEGVYQVEVEGYQAGSYRLSLILDQPLAGAVDQPAGLERRPRISVLALNPPEPANNPGILPGAPVEEILAGLSTTVYLPILRQ